MLQHDAPHRTPARPGLTWRERVAAAAAAGAALAVYIRTLAPGVTSDVDTALFQFVGRVLGVAHNPGYPFYVLVTHVYSYLPVGSLAYRINLFSALLGAAAVGLTYLVGRRLGCGLPAAMAGALGLAFAPIFWSQSLIAEVYTLNAAILSGVLLGLLTWRETGRARWYYMAVALFAAGLGNHTTIFAFAPGAVAFVLLVDHRFALRLRTIGVTTAILACGLLQYSFILVRSSQPDAYVESKASSLRQLVSVMLAREFQNRLFTFDMRTVLTDRLPDAFRYVLLPSLTVPGLLLAAIGTAWLLRRRLADAALLLPGGLAILAFGLNYSVVDVPVFLIPLVLVLWLAAAVGVEWTAGIAARFRALGPVTAAAALLVPAWVAAANFDSVDRSRDVKISTELDALFEALPDRSALARQDFLSDRLVMFELLGREAARGRRIDLLPRDPDVIEREIAAGAHVFAFPRAAAALRFAGLQVAFDPMRLVDGTLEGFLENLPDGAVVAMAVPANLVNQFVTAPGLGLGAIGVAGRLTVQPQSSLVVVGVRGATGGAIVESGRAEVECVLPAGGGIGGTGRTTPAALIARAVAFDASIRQGGRDVVRTSAGIAVAAWSADGLLQHGFVLEPAHRLHVPVETGPLAAYAVQGRSTGRTIRGDWTDISAVLDTGTGMLQVPAGGTVVLWTGDDHPLAPRVISASSRARVRVKPFEGRASAFERRVALDADGLGGAALVGDQSAYRVELGARGAPVSALLAMGGVPAHGLALAGGSGATRLYRVSVDGLLRTPDSASELLVMSRDDQSQLTGAGWSEVDSDAVGPYRWMTSAEAQWVLPVSRQGARLIRIQALRKAESPATSVRLRLNTTTLPPLPLEAGWHSYEWTVPEGIITPGPNEAALIVEGPPVLAGPGGGPTVAVTDVRLVQQRR